MPSNKDRIYIALYARGGRYPNTYHWALIVGPKQEKEASTAFRHHVKQNVGSSQWNYNVQSITTQATQMLLVRVVFAKVENGAQLNRTLESIPAVQNDPSWTCRVWVKDAIAALEADGKSLGPKSRTGTNWRTSRKRKWDPKYPPTYDLLEVEEIIP